MRLALAVFLSASLLIDPASCIERAREAMLLWARSVAPALFPFMALLPSLTDEYAQNAYERLFGRMTNKLFRVSGKAASLMVVGIIAGSPAGAMAIQRAGSSLTRREREITSAVSCGAGPVFVISSVGVNMFLSPVVGVKLFLAALISNVCTAFLLSRMLTESGGVFCQAEETKKRSGAVSEAVGGILTVCGYMTSFYVFAGWLPGWIYQAFEISNGCAYAARMGLVPLAGGVIGFGGVCAICQNLQYLKKAGVRTKVFLAVKAFEGVLSAAIVKMISGIQVTDGNIPFDTYELSCMCACALMIFILVFALYKMRKQRI